MADVRITQYPLKSIVSDNDIFLIADSNDVDVNGFLKYKKVRAKDLPSIVNAAESITYANLMASIAADDLIIGTFYIITDSTSGVSPLLVQAVGVDAIGYLAFDASNPLVTINYDVMTDTIRWSLNETAAPISLGSLSATTPLSYNNTTGVFTISQSNTTTNGYLSSADWNTFTAKQNAGNYITALTGEATASGPVGGGSAAITLDNTAVIGKVLSGLNVTGGNVVSTDSILTAFGKTQNQINALVGGVMFQGVWDAATNNPALTSSVGTKGYYYVVNVAGSTNLNGITDWKVGDWAIFDGTAWQKVDNTDSVSSVFGRVGAVVAASGDYTTTQVTEGTNLYYTEARVDANSNVAANTAARHNAVTLGTANGLSLSTQQLSLGLASGSTNGALSSTDWSTFNGKQNALGGTGIVKSTGGTISYLTDNSTNWDTAYNDSIVSAGVTGTTTKTLTLNQQDGGTITASWTDINTDAVSSVFGRTGAVVAAEGDYSLTQLSDVTLSSPTNGQVLKYNGTSWVNGTDTDTGLTSVGLSMPSAFSVANSPLTANGTLAVTGAGVASQYVRGDGTLAAFPTTTGAGSSVSYYFNGGTNQGTIGGNTYYEMSTTAIIGTNADFNINADGYIAQFVTDANDPSLLSIPAGNWNFEMWFSASSGGGSPSFYLELYKYDGATLTLISSGSANPEAITGGTAIDLYTTALAVPLTTLALTDRLAVRVYVNHSSKTITLHTQNGHLCQAITTFSTGLTALNGLTSQVQYLATGTSGTDFGISSATSTHTFNLPTASATNRGALSSADWTTFNNKQNALTNPITGTGTTNYLPKFTGTSALGNSNIQDSGSLVSIGVSTLINTGTANQNTKIFGDKVGMSRTSDGAEVVYFSKNTDLGADGTANINGYNGIQFRTQGAETVKATITEAGNFGIGTPSPTTKLGVAGDITLQLSGAAIRDINNNALLSVQSSNELWLGGGGVGFSTIFYAGAAERMRITSGGDVYVNATSGNGKLTVRGSGTTSSAYSFEAANSSGNSLFIVRNDGLNYMSRNLLIATGTDAGYTLDVNGTARVSGDAYFGTFNGNDKYHFEPFTNLAGGANNAYLVSGKADNNERSGFVLQARNSIGEEYNAVVIEGYNSTATNTPLTIDSTGNVGVGNPSPSERLSVASTDEYLLSWQRTGDSKRWAFGADSSGTFISNRTDSVLPLFIKNSGNVLIGTITDAGYKLDVNGTARVFGTSAELRIQSTSINQNAEIFFASTATTWRVGQNIGTATDFEIYNGGTLFKMNTSGAATFSSLAGTGDRMVISNASGTLSTQAIPSVGSGTTNYVSKWNGTTLTDSLFYSDANVAKTIHSGSDNGLYIDFTNNISKFGVINVNGIKVGISNTQIGDYDFDDTGTILSVDRGNEIIKTSSQGSDKGLHIDYPNNIYALGFTETGDWVGENIVGFGQKGYVSTMGHAWEGANIYIDSTYPNQIIKTRADGGSDKGLYIDFVNDIYLLGNEGAGWGNMRSDNNTVTIGDTAYNNFGTKFIVDDTNQIIKTQNPNDKGLYIDYPNNIYALGFTDGGNPFTDPVDGFVYTSDYTTIGSRWNWGEYIEIAHNVQRINLETNRLHYRNLTTTEINALTGNLKGDVVCDSTISSIKYYNGANFETLPTVENIIKNKNSSVGIVETRDKTLLTIGASLNTGVVIFTYFTPLVDTTISQISTFCLAQTTNATLSRMGLYTRDEATNTNTLVARIASDTTLWNTSNVSCTRSLSTVGGYPSSYTLIAGQRYALGVINIGVTSPALAASNITNLNINLIDVKLSASLASQTDLPTSATPTTYINQSAYGRFL